MQSKCLLIIWPSDFFLQKFMIYRPDHVCLSVYVCLSVSVSVCLPVCLSGVWVCACPLQAIPRKLLKSSSSNLTCMVTVSDIRMHRVLIILTLTFIQGHTDQNHENNTCLIISETIQAMPITFAVWIVQLKVYMTIASLLTLTFIQGHKCISNLTTF